VPALRPRHRASLVPLLLFGLACAGTQDGAADSAPRPGVARDFSLKDLQGRTVTLSEFADRPAVLLDFWALWCHPCRTELPQLEALYQTLKDRGFVLLAINTDEAAKTAEVRAFVRQRGLTFPVLLDAQTRVVSRYNPSLSLPFAVLLGPGGTVVRTIEGFQPGEEKALEAEIEALLAGGAG